VAGLTFLCELLAATHIDPMPLQICNSSFFDNGRNVFSFLAKTLSDCAMGMRTSLGEQRSNSAQARALFARVQFIIAIVVGV
jgi:hypothetical protein